MLSKAVLKQEDAEKVAVTYTPKKFPTMISSAAHDFVAYQSTQEKPSFRIDRIVAQQTGVGELERLSIEERVEREALEKLKTIQEEAYQQAHQLGLEEGREQAFREHEAEFKEKLEQLDRLLDEIGRLKTELVHHNEAHIVKTIFHMASRIVMDEVRDRPELIVSVLRQAVESAQGEEKVTARVANADFDFIEQVRAKVGKDSDVLKKVKLEAADEVSPGGCVIETNFGVVDATVEKRIEKLWEAVSEKLPKTKDVVGG